MVTEKQDLRLKLPLNLLVVGMGVGMVGAGLPLSLQVASGSKDESTTHPLPVVGKGRDTQGRVPAGGVLGGQLLGSFISIADIVGSTGQPVGAWGVGNGSGAELQAIVGSFSTCSSQPSCCRKDITNHQKNNKKTKTLFRPKHACVQLQVQTSGRMPDANGPCCGPLIVTLNQVKPSLLQMA